MAFGGNPTSTNTDGVRVLVGDISTSNSLVYLPDSAYTFFRAQTPNVYSAAALAANSLAAFFMGRGSEKKVGDMILRREMAQQFRALSIELKTMSAKNMAPYAGGISKSDKRAVQQDSDKLSPFFRRSQFDNRYALDPQRSTST